MPNIPFNPSIRAVGASQVRAVTNRTQQANAVQQQATQGLVSAARDTTLAAGGLYVDEMEKQFNTDMLAGGAMLDELKFKRDEELSNIPVSSSVDYDKVSGEINTKYDNEWSQWSSKNVRNLNHELVSDMRQRSINAFGLDGQTTNEKNKVVYENKRNLDQLAKADGIYATQMNRDPYNREPLEKMKVNQDALVIMGAKTEAEAIEKKAELEYLNDKLADEATISTAKSAVLVGDTARARELLADGLTGQYTNSEADILSDKVIGSATYERFDLIASQTESVEGWSQYDELLLDDTDMNVKHHAGLKQRSVVGLRKIERGQKILEKKFSADSRRGVFDLNEYRSASENDTSEGLSMVSSDAMEDAYILNASLYNSKEQSSNDRRTYATASRSESSGGDAGVKKQADKISNWQINGDLTQDELIDELKHIKKQGKDRKWGKPVIREMERELMRAHEASLGDSVLIEDDWFNTEMPKGVVNAYNLINPAFMSQNKRLGEFLNYSGNSERIRAGLKEWIDINPNPSPAEVKEEATKWSNWIIESTIIEARRRI